MKGKSIKTIEHLKKVKRSPVKLLVRSWELGSKSRLPRKDAAFYIIKKEPVQKVRLMSFTPVDNFARADYRGTLLPRIKEIKSHYLSERS